MCNEELRLFDFLPQWRGKLVKEIFPQSVMARFVPELLKPSHCLICGEGMAYAEIRPNGFTPRCMHNWCFQEEIVNRINYSCIVSDVPLSSEKIRAQQMNPREVANNIVDGYARDYYTYIANVVYGIIKQFHPDSLQANRHNPLELPEPSHQDTVSSFFEGYNHPKEEELVEVDLTQKTPGGAYEYQGTFSAPQNHRGMPGGNGRKVR
jgi:hypothetical protein